MLVYFLYEITIRNEKLYYYSVEIIISKLSLVCLLSHIILTIDFTKCWFFIKYLNCGFNSFDEI